MDKEARHDREASVNGEADRMKLLLENWRKYLNEVNEVKFKNELGNEIVIEIKKVKDTGTNSKGEEEEFDAI